MTPTIPQTAPGVRIRHATVEDLPGLEKLAAQDNHGALFPTHIVEKRNQMVGYLHIGHGAFPLVLVWMDTQLTNSRDSIAVLNFFENAARDRGAVAIALPCKVDSPYYGYLSRLGYIPSKTEMFMRHL